MEQILKLNKSLWRNISIAPLLLIIYAYKGAISPLLPASCRFTPTCSTYALEALKKYGLFKGFFFAFKRIIRCHPFGGKGYDPVP